MGARSGPRRAYAVRVWLGIARKPTSLAASLIKKGASLKKLLASVVVALAVAAASPSAADDGLQCFPAGPVFFWGFIIAPCELGQPMTTCLRCVTSVDVPGDPVYEMP